MKNIVHRTMVQHGIPTKVSIPEASHEVDCSMHDDVGQFVREHSVAFSGARYAILVPYRSALIVCCTTCIACANVTMITTENGLLFWSERGRELEKEWFVGYDVALCQVGRCMETRELLRSTRPRLAVSLVLEVVVQQAAEPTWPKHDSDHP